MSQIEGPRGKGASKAGGTAAGKNVADTPNPSVIAPKRMVAAAPPVPPVSKPSKTAIAKPPAPVKSAIEIAPVAEPSLAEKIESAVAPAIPADAPAAVPVAEPTPAPAPAVAVMNAAPVPVAAPKVEPAPVVSAIPEVVRPKPEPVAAFAPAKIKGFFDMATSFDSISTPAAATQKVQAMFGGLNDRAKTAMEKSAKLGEELTELTKGNVEALVASGKVAAKGAETMAQEAAEYGKKNFESATAMFKSLASAKSPTEMFQLQSEYAKSSFDSAVAEASKLSEAWVKLAGEMVQPISSRYAVAADKIKSAAL